MTSAAARTARAFRDVLLFLLVDAFDLAAAEIVICGVTLDELLAQCRVRAPERLPVAVAQELLTGRYSLALDRRLGAGAEHSMAVADALTTRASALVWAVSMSNFVGESYAMSEAAILVMRLRLAGLLERDLGVGEGDGQRASAYLPNDVRLLLAERSQRAGR